MKQAVAVLEQRSDADSLAAAALFLQFMQPGPDAAIALVSRAVTVAPERPDLAWLDIQMCEKITGCDSAPEELHLRELDPDNGVAWLQAVTRANASNDEAAKAAVLSGLARTERVDIYWTTLIAHLARALADTEKVPPEEALVAVIGVLAVQAIPAYSATSNLCRGERLNDPEVVKECRRIALAFERGDTVITELMGLAMAQHIWPTDSPEWTAAAGQRRVTKFRIQMASQVEAKSGTGTRWAEEYLSLCAQNRREQDVLLAEIINAGKSAMPPPNWAP